MQILLISPQPFFTERGTPIAVRRLAEALCADGHQLDLLTFPFGTDLEVEGLTIHRCGRFPGVRDVGIGFSLAKLLMDFMLLGKLLRLARPGCYDVVHAVEESIYPALLLRWWHGASVIYDMDSSLAEQLVESHPGFRPLYPLLSWIERRAIRSADLVVPMCHDLAHYAGRMRNGNNVVVLHDIPVDADPSATVEWLRDSDAERCLALYVGNLEPYQGIDLLVEAVALLPEGSPVRVVVVGGPEDEVERYRELSGRRGLESRIRFVGPRPIAQLRSLLAQADILVSPRTMGNNTPLKLYSYMDSGRPILATRLRTHTQVLDDATALLVEPTPDLFARGLLRLAEDGALRRKLATAAKRRVTHNYSLSTFNDRVRNIYPRSQKQEPAGRPRLELPPEARLIEEGASRRMRSDRRSGRDRRTSARSTLDRRAGPRRAFVYAGVGAH